MRHYAYRLGMGTIRRPVSDARPNKGQGQMPLLVTERMLLQVTWGFHLNVPISWQAVPCWCRPGVKALLSSCMIEAYLQSDAQFPPRSISPSIQLAFVFKLAHVVYMECRYRKEPNPMFHWRFRVEGWSVRYPMTAYVNRITFRLPETHLNPVRGMCFA